MPSSPKLENKAVFSNGWLYFGYRDRFYFEICFIFFLHIWFFCFKQACRWSRAVGGASGKGAYPVQETQENACLIPGLGRDPWRRNYVCFHFPIFLPGEFHVWAQWATVHGVTKLSELPIEVTLALNEGNKAIYSLKWYPCAVRPISTPNRSLLSLLISCCCCF